MYHFFFTRVIQYGHHTPEGTLEVKNLNLTCSKKKKKQLQANVFQHPLVNPNACNLTLISYPAATCVGLTFMSVRTMERSCTWTHERSWTELSFTNIKWNRCFWLRWIGIVCGWTLSWTDKSGEQSDVYREYWHQKKDQWSILECCTAICSS